MAIFTLKQLLVYGFNKAESIAGRDIDKARDLFLNMDNMYIDNFPRKDDEIEVLRDEVNQSLYKGFWEAK